MTTSENVCDMMYSLRGQRVMVTGASSGIGRATSLALAELGAHVVLVGRNVEKLEATASLLSAGASTICPFDLRDAQSIGRWMTELAGKLGPLSGLVHCAGDRRTLPIRAFSPSVFEESLRINTLATFALVAGFRSKFVCQDAGSIVIISSVAAFVGEGGMGFYCASKGAISAAVKAWAIELASQKIRVNCIAPGLVQTDMMDQIKSSLTADQFKAVEGMHPLGLGRPEDVAGSAAFLLSGAARWITGTSLIVDGGYTAR